MVIVASVCFLLLYLIGMFLVACGGVIAWREYAWRSAIFAFAILLVNAAVVSQG